MGSHTMHTRRTLNHLKAHHRGVVTNFDWSTYYLNNESVQNGCSRWSAFDLYISLAMVELFDEKALIVTLISMMLHARAG